MLGAMRVGGHLAGRLAGMHALWPSLIGRSRQVERFRTDIEADHQAVGDAPGAIDEEVGCVAADFASRPLEEREPALEDDMRLVECLGEGPATCVLTGACRLTRALARALEAFLAELDKLTLADLAGGRTAMRDRLGMRA
jgi:hypothetical protein